MVYMKVEFSFNAVEEAKVMKSRRLVLYILLADSLKSGESKAGQKANPCMS